MRYPSCPEIIGTVTEITQNGNSHIIGDRVAGISVEQRESYSADDAEITVDVRGYPGRTNLMITFSLQELVKAITAATLGKP